MQFKKKSTLFLSFLFLITISSQAQVLWYGDPDRDYRQSFYRLSRESGETGTVSTVNDAEYGKVWKLNKPAGEKRCEFARTEGTVNSYTPKEGDLLYLGWRMKFNIAGSSNPSGFAIFQWKSNAGHSQNYPFLMGYDGREFSLSAYDAGPGSQASRKEELFEYPLPENEWVTVVLGIKVSKNENNGYLECWVNGVKQTLNGGDANKRFKHRTLDDNGNYCKWGAYNEAARPFNIDAYFDEMRFGSTLASVLDPLGGGGNNNGNTPPTVSVTSPSNNAVFNIGETINLGANASDSDGSVDRVNFKVNGSYYSTDNSAPYTGVFQPTTAGIYTISARAFDNEGDATEKTVTVQVKEPNRDPVGVFLAPSQGSFSVGYSALYVKVDASDPDNDPLTLTLFINDTELRPENNPPYEWGHVSTNPVTETELLGLSAGTYDFKVTIDDRKGGFTTINKIITITEPKSPFLGSPVQLPGILEAENYDLGGQGVSYNDMNVENTGGAYRQDGVDISQQGTDNYTVGWNSTGEWLEYSVNVSETATYNVIFNYSSGATEPGMIGLESAGDELLSNVSLPPTGDWNTYVLSSPKSVDLTAGEQVLRVRIDKNGFNLDRIEVNKSTVTSIDSRLESKLEVFPNPTSSGQFTLTEFANWELYNLQGLKLASGYGKEIDSSTLRKGSYLLRIDNSAIKIVVN